MSNPPLNDSSVSTFRSGELADLPALLELVQASYRGEASRVGWTTEADLLDGQRTDARELTEIMDAPDSRLIVAETGGELVGCCHVERHDDGVTHLGLFAVRPDRQGSGVGRAIVGEAERFARDSWHATHMTMFVIRQRDDLIAWYERLGYERTGAFAPFPYGDEHFGIPRRPDLEFAVITKALVRESPA